MARRQGVSVSTLIGRAALYYLVERESDRPAARVPGLSREHPAEKKDGLLRVTIELPSRGLSGRVAALLLESAEAEVE